MSGHVVSALLHVNKWEKAALRSTAADSALCELVFFCTCTRRGCCRSESSHGSAIHTSKAALLLTRSVVVIATAAWWAPSGLSSRLATSFGTAACRAWSLHAEQSIHHEGRPQLWICSAGGHLCHKECIAYNND